MNNWMLFWSIFLFAAIAAFAVMSVVVSIGGARDIRKMLARLNELGEHDNDDDPPSPRDR